MNIIYLLYNFLKRSFKPKFYTNLSYYTSIDYVNNIAKVPIMMGGKNLYDKI